MNVCQYHTVRILTKVFHHVYTQGWSFTVIHLPEPTCLIFKDVGHLFFLVRISPAVSKYTLMWTETAWSYKLLSFRDFYFFIFVMGTLLVYFVAIKWLTGQLVIPIAHLQRKNKIKQIKNNKTAAITKPWL